tara:strand:+ start:560 stop:2140 length:1581 start_codon:yes stop_codon:yes gene_type:complete
MKLSIEQLLAFNYSKSGENVFITGAGGTGKSELLKNIVTYAKNKGKRVQITSTTGCSAVLLGCGAKTINSWAGIGLAKKDNKTILKNIINNKRVKNNWLSVDILIVDEVSMMSVKIFELLDSIGKMFRNNDKYFGGIQVIFTGDFLQLPPVGDKHDPDSEKFCFQSSIWEKVFKNQIELKTIFRQNDAIFTKILNQVRVGAISNSTIKLLSSLILKKKDKNDIHPTILLPKKNEVNKINEKEMKKIKEPEKVFKIKRCEDFELELTREEREINSNFTTQDKARELDFLKKNTRCDENLILKKGAHVMCIVNISTENQISICNGSQGIITDFNPEGYPIVRFNNNIIRTMTPHIWKSDNIPSVAIKQVPLIPSWAITIHKSQGATLEVLEIDIGTSIFAAGQTYVAMSRAKSLDGLYIKSFNYKSIKVSNIVTKYYEKLNKKNKKLFEKKEYHIDEETKETGEISKCSLKKGDIIKIDPYHEKIENGTEITTTCDCCDEEYDATILNSILINNKENYVEWVHDIIVM